MKDPGNEVEDLIKTMTKRPLSEAERIRLNELLRESPEALDTWLDHCDMSTWLAAAGPALSDRRYSVPNTVPYTVPSSTVQCTVRRKRTWLISGIAAAVSLLAFLYIKNKPPTGDSTVAESEPNKESRQEQYEKIIATLPTTGSQTRPPTSFENVSLEKTDQTVDFNQDIRPILTENCIACHGPDEHGRKAKLRLDTFVGATESVIIPGDAENSELMARILTNDPDDIMPPPDSHKSLTDKQKELLARWIDQGAEYKEHWAFIRPTSPPDLTGAKHPIDQLVEKKLKKKGLSLSQRADANTLLRRVSFDLTGLPPSLEMIDRYTADLSPDKYEMLIDSLLAQPTFGEHRARYWLDAARYGDTHGLHLDNYREIWPYRDWVINAYNGNTPFDQFTIEQIAGDLLPDATQDQRVATGFNRCNVTTSEGGAIDDEFYVRYAVDRVSTTSTVWMGLTAGCAQCHDHKFDPLTMKDFYQLYAFFNNTTQKAMDGNIKDTPPVIHVYPDKASEGMAAELTRRAGALTKEWQQVKKAEKAAAEAWAKTVAPESLDQFTTPALENNTAVPVEISGFKNPGKHDRFSISFRCVMPTSGPSILFDNTNPNNANRGIRIRVEDERIYVELIEAWPNRMLRTGAARAFKAGSHSHFAVTYDGSGSSKGIRMYSNGKWINSRFATEWKDTLESDFATDTPAKIGGADPETGLHARISEFHTYNETLSDESILALSQYSLSHQISKKPIEKRSQKDIQTLVDFYSALISEKGASALAKLEDTRVQLRQLQADAPTTLVMHEKEGEPTAHILNRGEYDQKLDEVGAAFPAFIGLDGENYEKNRLGLAKWLVDPEHPLTARVTVNRVWQELFGRGIVRTSEDFGTQGSPPSNRELLDYLATYFIKSGWDIKGLYRHIMLSDTYQQTSRATREMLERDPENIWLARGPRFRLDGEVIRDQALFASGLIDESIGGPSVKPYQPAGLWKTVGYTNSNTQTFLQDYGKGPEHRRSLYSFWKRTAPPPNMSIFDAPDRESCIVRRERTNTPLQALVLMNDPQFLRAARFIALRTLTEAGDVDDERIDFLARLTVSRDFTSEERQLVKNSLTQFRDKYTSDTDGAEALLIDEVNHAFSISTDAFGPDELASWTMVASQMMNLDESVTKN